MTNEYIIERLKAHALDGYLHDYLTENFLTMDELRQQDIVDIMIDIKQWLDPTWTPADRGGPCDLPGGHSLEYWIG